MKKKKNKMKLSKKQFPKQIVEPQIDKLKITEEEEKKKKGIIGWFKTHKTGTVIITSVVIAAVLAIAISSCNDLKDLDDSELPDDPGYEDMQDEKDDGTLHDPETPIIDEGIVQFPELPIIKEEENKPSEEIKNHEHVYGSSVEIVYEYAKNDKHNKKTISTCSSCGHVEETVESDACKYTITSYNGRYEFVVCDECGNKASKRHVLDKGTEDKNGSIVYNCVHEGCDYKKVVEQTKDNSNNNNSTSSKPTSSNPTSSKPTSSNPTSSKPTSSSTTSSEPTSSNPTSSEPTSSNPTSSESTSSNPTSSEPTSSNPTSSEPTESEPTSSNSTSSEPTESEPDRDHQGDGGSGSGNVENGGETDKEEDGFQPDDDVEEENVLKDSNSVVATKSGDALDGEKSVQTKLQILRTMKEMVINGTVFEYPAQAQQHTLKKVNKITDKAKYRFY